MPASTGPKPRHYVALRKRVFNKRLGALLFICLVCRRSPESSPPTPSLRRARAAQTPAPSADTRRAGLSDSAPCGASSNVCTLYPVFKEPRHPSAAQRAIRHTVRLFGVPEPPSLLLRWRPLGEPCESSALFVAVSTPTSSPNRLFENPFAVELGAAVGCERL
jgi:hypothetical protein